MHYAGSYEMLLTVPLTRSPRSNLSQTANIYKIHDDFLNVKDLKGIVVNQTHQSTTGRLIEEKSIYKFGLSVCLFVCLFVSNKRQNG